MRRPEILLSELKPSMQLVPEPLRPWSIISDAAAPEDGPHSTGCGPFHFGGGTCACDERGLSGTTLYSVPLNRIPAPETRVRRAHALAWRGSIKKQSEHRRTPREQVVSSLVEQFDEALAIKTARDIHPSLHQETLDLGGPHAWMSRADRICLRCATGA